MQNAKVRLRPITLDDAIHYERLLGDDWNSIKTTATIPCPCTEAAAREWLAPRIELPNRVFAILRQPDDEFVGAIGLVAKSDDVFEVGYWVGRVHSGNGYAFAALQLLIEVAHSLKAPKLLGCTFPENLASARVLQKAGFVFTGTSEMDFPLRGGLRTNHEYELKLA